MSVDEHAAQFEGYALKLNSYDIGVDIELYDAVQRLRFEHPGIKAVVLTSAKPGMFCAGANIRMLGSASPLTRSTSASSPTRRATRWKDAGRHSGQAYIAALNGPAAAAGTSSRSPPITLC